MQRSQPRRPRAFARAALPVAIAALAALAGPAATASGAVRVSVNRALLPDRNPIPGRDAVALAANPRKPRHLVALYADWHTLWCEVASSTNNGRTWRRARLKAPEGFVWPPCTVGGHLSGQLDAGIAFGRRGRVYATFSSARVRPDGDPEGQSVLVARSNDGGRSFRTGVVALEGGPTGSTGPDYVLPKLAVQTRRGRADRLYVIAGVSEHDPQGQSQENTVLTVSSDGGATWSPRKTLNPPDQNAIEQSQPVIGKRGSLYVAWRARGRGDRPGQFVPEGRVIVARSRDRGRTWALSTAANVRGYVFEGPPQPPFQNVQSYTASTFPRLAADRRNGNVYLAYGNGERPTVPGQAQAADHFIHPDLDVWFQRSTDGGATWSQPDRINRSPRVQTEITQTRHPNLSVAPNGRLDVVWHDRRHWYRGCYHTHVPCEEARLGDTYYRYSTDGGETFRAERRISDRSTNNDVGFDYRFGTYWDFGPSAVPRGRHGLLVAWMDSRRGNVETDRQDIYLARVNLRARGRAPRRAIRAPSREAFALGMSRWTYPGGAEAVLAGTFATRPWARAVIVNEGDPVGALAGGVLGRAFLGPVLPSPAKGLTKAAKAELTRLAPLGAFLIGGAGSLSEKVVDDLAATGIPRDQITRISAPGDEARTAALVAQAMDRRTAAQKRAKRAAFNGAILVNPRSRHSFAASVLAANRRLPVLLTGRDALPAATAEALESLGIPRTLVIGNEGAISDAVAAQVPKPQRLGGSDPHATSRAVLHESWRRGVPHNLVFDVDESRTMEAALLGATVGRMGGVLLLTGRGEEDTRSALGEMKLNSQVDRVFKVRVANRRRR